MKIIALELSEVTGLVKAALPLGGGMAVTKSRLFPGIRVAISALVLLAMAPAMYPQTGSTESGPDVSNYISPSLEPGEHEYMQSAINQLPASMREKFLRTDPTHVSISVYDGATGEMHYSRPELAGNLHLEPSHPLPGDDYPLALGGSKDGLSGAMPQTITSCGGSPAPGCISGAGPYRRIFTPQVAAEVTCPSGVKRPCTPANGTNNGYWISGSVTTACKAGIFKDKGDIGFVYLGGYSTKPDETGGSVDAGLQYNYEDDPSLPNLDNYELFIGIRNEPKLVYTSTNPPGALKPDFIDCGGPPASMEFRVAPWELNLARSGTGCVSSKTVTSSYQLEACGTFAFILERGVGGIGEQHNEQVIVWVAPDISYGGWGVFATSNQGTTKKPQPEYFPQVPCGGCIFKWVTGIGQEQENLTDGSLFSATWSDRGIAPWATNPGDLQLPPYGNPVPMTENLTLCTEYPLWRGIYDGTTAKEDCSDTPDVTGNAGDVKVAMYNVEGELDSITLTDKGIPTTKPPVDPHIE
jgi:hypothetical protein